MHDAGADEMCTWRVIGEDRTACTIGSRREVHVAAINSRGDIP